jgi:uncharacterized protein
MRYDEIPLTFDCLGTPLVGVLALPATPARIGVVVVVGGPQYRVGSHRQFVLLARVLAQAGVACLRFDYRGMGDSEGEPVAFDATGADIEAAVCELRRRLRAASSIVLWGLCDGAAASAFAAAKAGVAGVVLVNPWVHTDEGGSQEALTHYYPRRLVERAFWRKVMSGRVEIARSMRALWRTVIDVVSSRLRPAAAGTQALPVRVADGIRSHSGPALIVLSGKDRTADEFRIHAARRGPLASALERRLVSVVEVPEADHTFSTARWSDELAAVTLRWIGEQFSHPLSQPLLK